MKKLSLGLLMLGALLLTSNAVVACDCSGGCEKAKCNCVKTCDCGCQNGKECNCDKNCDCKKGADENCNCVTKKFGIFRKKQCNCEK